jgi:hypothetical protein
MLGEATGRVPDPLPRIAREPAEPAWSLDVVEIEALSGVALISVTHEKCGLIAAAPLMKIPKRLQLVSVLRGSDDRANKEQMVTKHRKRGTPWPLESPARVSGGRVPTLSDEPIHSREEDRLGRAAYAPILARALIEYPETSSLVVTLYSDWGSGKTSTLDLCFQALRDLLPKGEPLGIATSRGGFQVRATYCGER